MSALRPLLRPALCGRSLSCPASACAFSTTSSLPARKTRDRSKHRGISPIHRTRGQKEPLEASRYDLPEPILDPSMRTKVETDEDHGLWGFFEDKKALRTPEEDHAHGRSWTPEELRQKSWEDLHKLWWVCVRERNIIATQMHERKRMKPGYGGFEALERDREVRKTMRAVKHALTERYYAWEEAKKLADKDPEVDWSGSEPVYKPQVYEEASESFEAGFQATKKSPEAKPGSGH